MREPFDIEVLNFSFWSNENDELIHVVHVIVYKTGAVAKFLLQLEVRSAWQRRLDLAISTYMRNSRAPEDVDLFSFLHAHCLRAYARCNSMGFHGQL
jgi:hypothetical protein